MRKISTGENVKILVMKFHYKRSRFVIAQYTVLQILAGTLSECHNIPTWMCPLHSWTSYGNWFTFHAGMRAMHYHKIFTDGIQRQLLVFVILLSIFMQTPAHMHAHCCTLPLTCKHSSMCWGMHTDGRMTKENYQSKLVITLRNKPESSNRHNLTDWFFWTLKRTPQRRYVLDGADLA